MKIVQISSWDLPGRIFDGYDLQLSLNEKGIDAKQMVMEQFGGPELSIPICKKDELEVRARLTGWSKRLGMANLLEPFTSKILYNNIFRDADVAHYHMIHNHVVSLLDLPELFESKPSLWTIHDPWVITGHCVHPLECNKWKTGCGNCHRLNDLAFPMDIDQTKSLWKIKRQVFQTIQDKVDIVVSSDWMLKLLKESPLTCNFKRVHKIPFGVDIKKYDAVNKVDVRKKLGISSESIVIGFRNEENIYKGVRYIEEALKGMTVDEKITILTVGRGILEEEIKRKFTVIELGWQGEEGMLQFFSSIDIFLMPSIAESFGMMAIEAMAARCAIIVFNNTALEGIVEAPKGGIAVPYKNADSLKKAIIELIENRWKLEEYANNSYRIAKQKYKYETYVERHIDLYHEVLKRKSESNGGVAKEFANVNERNETIGEKIMGGEATKKLRLFAKSNSNIYIYCAGVYGRTLLNFLEEKAIDVAGIIDKNSEKWGPFSKSVRCFGIEQIEEEKDTALIIVANKSPKDIVDELKKKGFCYVVEKKDVEAVLLDCPTVYDLSIQELSDLDYSDEKIQNLIKHFNEIIAEICTYYESQLNKLK